MAPTRSSRNDSKLPSGPTKCSVCRLYGFKSGDTLDHSNLPELQSNPRDPMFVSHAACLVSSSNLDGFSEEAGLRDAASQADAIFALQAVISSVLRSPSFSPAERANILRDTRASLARDYHLHRGDLDFILSERFRSLNGFTPLEYEIQRWDPIWEGSVGMGSYSSGMEIIQFLIEHWKPLVHSSDGRSDEPVDIPDGEILDSHNELISIVRNACLHRLDSFTSDSVSLDEDNTNTLFQRIFRFIWSHITVKDNDLHDTEQTFTAIGASDFKVSVAYNPAPINSQINAFHTRPSSSRSCNIDGEDVDFTALVSIAHFPALLRDSVLDTPPPETLSRATPAMASNSNMPLSSSREHYHDNRRHRPYTLPVLQNRPRLSEVARPSVSTTSTSHVESEYRIPTASPRVLLVEFLAAHRAWTLTVGRNELELAIHGQGSPAKPDPDFGLSSDTDNSPGSETMVHAEVRIVPPASASLFLEDEAPEHVFTFPTILDTSRCSPDKTSHRKSLDVVRLSPCFQPIHPKAATHGNAKPPAARFDDARLLHAGELLLELRVRIQSSPSESTNAYLCADRAPDSLAAESISDDAELDASAWSALSVPPTSASASGVISFASSDMTSGPPSTSAADASELSWVQVQ